MLGSGGALAVKIAPVPSVLQNELFNALLNALNWLLYATGYPGLSITTMHVMWYILHEHHCPVSW